MTLVSVVTKSRTKERTEEIHRRHTILSPRSIFTLFYGKMRGPLRVSFWSKGPTAWKSHLRSVWQRSLRKPDIAGEKPRLRAYQCMQRGARGSSGYPRSRRCPADAVHESWSGDKLGREVAQVLRCRTSPCSPVQTGGTGDPMFARKRAQPCPDLSSR